MAKIAVFCSGFGSNFQAILDAVKLGNLKAEIALLVCDKEGAHALERAKKHKVPVFLFNPKSFPSREQYERTIVSVLKSQNIDIVVLAGFMRIFTPYFIEAYEGRILNIHPSLLPAFKGAHAIRDAFQAGVKETGVTVHLVTAEVDAGPVLVQKKVPVAKAETLETLEAKIHKAEHELYPQAIKNFISKLKTTSK